MYENPKFIFGANGSRGSLELWHKEAAVIVKFPLNNDQNKELTETFGVDVGSSYQSGFKVEASISKVQINYTIHKDFSNESLYRFSIKVSDAQKEKFTELVKKIYKFYNIVDDVVAI